MIVKLISMDIQVHDEDCDLEGELKALLEENGYNVLGTNQEDISWAYNKEGLR